MEKLRLLDGTEYTLAINGVAELGEKVQIKVKLYFTVYS